MPVDIMRNVRGEPSTPSFVRSPELDQPLFCQLIALRRSINQTSKKSGPIEKRCEDCGDTVVGGRGGRRFCSETCRKRAEGKRRYERIKEAA